MKRKVISVILIFLVLPALAGCTSGNKKEQPNSSAGTRSYLGALIITWEFENIEKDSKPYTKVNIIITGEHEQKEYVGLFYGKVSKHLSIGKNPALMGGAFSGFITYNAGSGHEVVARYTDRPHRIIIVTRGIIEGSSPSNFKTLKSIPINEKDRLNTGF